MGERKSRRKSRRRAERTGAQPVKAAGASIMALPASMLIRDVAAVADVLRASLAAGVLAVDASAVAAIDTAGIQLLLAAERSARERGIPARWLGASETLKAAASALGVADALSLEAVA